MSRSYKKRPYWAWCGGNSQKDWKRCYNRQHRHINNQRLRTQGEDADFVGLDYGEGDPWSSPQDGSRGYRGPRPIDGPEYHRYDWHTISDAQEWWDKQMRK